MLESAERKRLENGAIVFALDAVGGHLRGFKLPAGASFVIEDGGIELYLGGEVPEDHCLRDACRLGNFPGRSAAETSLREEFYGYRKNLQTPLLTRHTRANRRAVNCYLLAQYSKATTKVSTYLPP